MSSLHILLCDASRIVYSINVLYSLYMYRCVIREYTVLSTTAAINLLPAFYIGDPVRETFIVEQRNVGFCDNMSRNITISDEDLIAACRILLPPSLPPMDLDKSITCPHLTARRHGPSITLRPQLQAGPHVPVVLSEFWVKELHIWFS